LKKIKNKNNNNAESVQGKQLFETGFGLVIKKSPQDSRVISLMSPRLWASFNPLSPLSVVSPKVRKFYQISV
jgi:hypothetical protein